MTSSAFTQARKNLSHKLFIDANKSSYSKAYYTGEYDLHMGYRLLAIDGSKLRLPDTDEVKKEFGEISIVNQTGYKSVYSGALCSVFYDVINEIAVDSVISHSSSSERDLAGKHVKKFCKRGDLILLDRGYCSYELFSSIVSRGGDFLCRLSSTSFNVVKEFLLEEDTIDKEIVLLPQKGLKSKIFFGKISKKLNVRLVKVVLPSGEIEVLMTSLLDNQKHKTSSFKDLYFKRWGIETYYDRLKNRLNLENFTGRTVESIKQDFYSTILVSNIESELSEDAEEELLKKKKKNKNKYRVNKAVSFNAVKHHVLDLILEPEHSLEDLQKKLTKIFMQTPTPIRKNRSFPRKTSPRRSLNYQKTKKKSVF